MKSNPHHPNLVLPCKKIRACIAPQDQKSTCTTSHPVEVVEQGLFVPLELFVDIVGRLGWKERVLLSHVSRAWGQAISMEPKFWTDLEVDLADGARAIQQATVFVGRSQGKLSSLRFDVDAKSQATSDLDVRDLVAQRQILDTLHLVLREISRSGALYLRSIYINLEVYKSRFRNVGSAILKRLAAFIQNAATEIEEFSCLSHFKEVSPLNFFNLTPSLRRLTITAQHQDHLQLKSVVPEAIDVEFWGRSLQDSPLTHLILYGATVSAASLPPLPYLTSLRLYKVRVPHLYTILKGCANTIQHLSLGKLTNTAPPLFALPPSHQTCLPKLILPKLASMQISSLEFSPWDQSRELSSDFAISTPNLTKVSFNNFVHHLPFELQAMHDRTDLLAEANEDPEDCTDTFLHSLKYLRFTAAPKLAELDIRGAFMLDPGEILDCLERCSSEIHTLSLPEITQYASMKRLATIFPSLTTLRMDGTESCLPLLAVLAESIELVRQASKKMLTIYILRTSAFVTWTEVEKSRMAFEGALRQISADQLEFILDEINGDATPDTASLKDLIEEVKDLWSKSFLVDSRMELSAPRGAGTTAQFKEAQINMFIWHRQRNIILAWQWFKKATARGFVVLYEKEGAF